MPPKPHHSDVLYHDICYSPSCPDQLRLLLSQPARTSRKSLEERALGRTNVKDAERGSLDGRRTMSRMPRKEDGAGVIGTKTVIEAVVEIETGIRIRRGRGGRRRNVESASVIADGIKSRSALYSIIHA